MGSEPKHRLEQDEVSQDRWLVSYADFITLLFAFFVILYATSEKDVEKSKEFQESIKRYLIKAGAFGESGQALQQGTKSNTVIDPPIQTYNTNKPETVQILDEAEAFLESQLSKEERKKFVTDISSDEWGVRIVIPARALFSSGSEKFQPGAVAFLGKLSDLLARSKRKILIEGHVGLGERGSFPSAWDFASARAINFLRFMQKKQSMATGLLASASLGDSRPLFESGEKADLNSRLEVVLLNPEFDL